MDNGESPFGAAVDCYEAAKAQVGKGQSFDQSVERIDEALDALLAAPSPSIVAFGIKMVILQAEYGFLPQPRHMAAIYVDVASLVVSYAEAALQALTPT